MLRTQVYLDEDDYIEVANLAAVEGVKKAVMLRMAVRKGLKQIKKQRQSKKEDWFVEFKKLVAKVRKEGSGWSGVNVEAEIDDMRRDRYG
jgi:hypothetical protein